MSTAVPPVAFDLMSGSFWSGDVHSTFTWMRQHAPVHNNGRVWGVATYDLVREISRRPAEFCNGAGARPDADPVPMMLDMDDPEHVKRRKLVNHGFTPRRVRESEPELRQICDVILDGVIESGSCDFVRDVAQWLPVIVIGRALGFPPDQYAALLRWSDELLAGLVGGDVDNLESMMDAYQSFRDFVVPAIEERRAAPRDDMLSKLVHAEVDGQRLGLEDLIHEALLILIAGDETTRHVISGGLYQLLCNPEQLAALRTDRNLLDGAIEEMLRWVSPVRNMNRTTTRPVDIGGVSLPQGAKVLLLYPSANRDESVFADPFRFDITRHPNEHIAFGLGSHHCLGANLARLELRCMFNRLLDRMQDIELVETSEPKNRPANFVSGYEAMPITFTPGEPLASTVA